MNLQPLRGPEPGEFLAVFARAHEYGVRPFLSQGEARDFVRGQLPGVSVRFRPYRWIGAVEPFGLMASFAVSGDGEPLPWEIWRCVSCDTAGAVHGRGSGDLSFVWAVRDAAAGALLETGEPERVRLLWRLVTVAREVNRRFVPGYPR